MLKDEGKVTEATALDTKSSSAPTKGQTEIKLIPIKQIKLGKNSRLNVTDNEIAGLMASIKEVGLLQPIGVTETAKGYEVTYGNRRFMAVSKLGKTKIPCVVHKKTNEATNDLQNLAENIQRRNISLTEAGRYMMLLEKQGLARTEIAARLGITRSYVDSCMVAFQDVPEKYRNDLEVKTINDRKSSPGKIAISEARAIINAGKSYGLTKKNQEFLFEQAKKNPNFNYKNIAKYAGALADGISDPVAVVPNTKRVAVQFWMDENEYNRLYNKHVVKGEFTTLGRFFISVLKGEKSEKMKISG